MLAAAPECAEGPDAVPLVAHWHGLAPAISARGRRTRAASRRDWTSWQTREGDGAHGALVITVLVVDDDDLVRAGLSLLLDSSGDLRVVGQAGDGDQAVALARRLRPDVILMDLSMPVLDGIEAIRQLMGEQPDTRAIVFTASAKSSRLAEALAAGAVSYLVKNCRPQDLLVAIRAAAQGKARTTR